MSASNQVIIIGTGPAALMAGTVLLGRGFSVHFYEQKKAAGRKFLVAGHGGFNLSNSIDKKSFLEMYDRKEIQEMVNEFDADDLVVFLSKIGIPTYVGSSGKLFPEKHIKPIDVLQQWLHFLKKEGASFNFETQLKDFDTEYIYLQKGAEQMQTPYDKLILALGGASWTKTGSTGAWLSLLESKKITVKPFQASNAGFNIDFSESIKSLQGVPIKHLMCRVGDKEKYGEIILTEYGFEGAPIFYLNDVFRKGNSILTIDAKPAFDEERIIKILKQAKNPTEGLKNLKISKILIAYAKEKMTKEAFLNPQCLASFIKNIPFKIESLRPIEEAISTVGGLSFDAVNDDLSLKRFANIYCCGEMLDWDAPTGGYLLQACFASGAWIGNKLK